MKPLPSLVLLALVVLLGRDASAQPQDTVRVPGNLTPLRSQKSARRDPAPPLAQEIVDKHMQFVEWVLDIKLNDGGRQQFQQLVRDWWKGADEQGRSTFLRSAENEIAHMQSLASKNNRCNYNIYHYIEQERFLESLRNENNPAALDRWLLASHEAVYKPGAEANPVLVSGNPPLTQQMVDRYCTYVENSIDLSISGGLRGPEREVIKGYLMRDWQGGEVSRQEILAALEEWHNIALKPPAEQGQWLIALRGRFLAHLRAHPQGERSQWLLARYDQEQQLFRLKMEFERKRHETIMDILRPRRRYDDR